MATTTPNFGWAVPTSSDLVKNGATAIETLGDAIDASMVDLKGGTTGQVLAKATNTDMDFTWSTPSAGSSYVAGKNVVLNSALNVWQRGTSFALTGSGIYTADRWYADGTGSGRTISRQVTGDTTNLPNIQYCVRIARDSGNTATNSVNFTQPVETLNSIPYAGQAVTISFYARKGANFSQASSQITVQLKTGTGTDQNVRVSYTGEATPINQNATLTTTWTRFSYSATLATTATEIQPLFNVGWAGTAGAADYVEITGVQLEIASSASAYSPNASTYQGEVAACQRYFYRFGGLIANEYFAIGTSVSATTAIGYASPKVSLRGTPTLTFTTASNYRVIEGTSQTTATSVNAEELSANNISFAFNASGFTIGRANRMNANNTTNGYIDISAEL